MCANTAVHKYKPVRANWPLDSNARTYAGTTYSSREGRRLPPQVAVRTPLRVAVPGHAEHVTSPALRCNGAGARDVRAGFCLNIMAFIMKCNGRSSAIHFHVVCAPQEVAAERCVLRRFCATPAPDDASRGVGRSGRGMFA